MAKLCAKCRFRAAYDRDNSSFVGRLWRWHINICPGWRLYYNSLNEAEREEIYNKYNFRR
ncbi:MAG: hypothetical protein SNF68_03395 [Rikenellaceae bacterium]